MSARYAALACVMLTCSDGARGAAAGGTRDSVAPPGIDVRALPGGSGVLSVIALSLREERGRIALYAALKNQGEIPACNAALAVEIFDRDGQSLAAGIGGVLARRFYRVSDAGSSIATCLAPGDLSMAALTDFPDALALADVRSVVYHCPYIALDVVPYGELTVREIHATRTESGTRYTGVLDNGLPAALHRPSVSVFSVTRAGRPVGVAVASVEDVIAPGASWAFETPESMQNEADFLALPAGALAN